MSRHLALLATLAVITVAACKASKPPAPKSDAPRSEDDGRLFVMARPEVTTRPMPARFTAALPASVAELASRDRLPPHAMLRAGIANGDAEVQRRLLRAIQTASTRGPVPDELREYYVGLFGYRASDAACAWLRVTVPRVTAAVRDVLLRPLATCRDDESGVVLLDTGAPAALIVDWAFEPGAEHPLPGDARIRAAMLEVARNGDPSDARKIGFVLARLGDVPAIFSATQALQRALPDPERRAWVAIGLLAHDSPAVRELGLEGCKHPVVAEDGMCDGSYGREPDEGGDPARRSLDEQLAYGFDADELAARFGPHEVAAALGRWATDPARAAHQRRSSLYDLATIDRAAAAKLAPLLLAHDD
ncbi:MAG: hypothetical protein K8M05_17805, partial [Deltaproteobacteria bacterium]|nr:hypothetical protein [Kofleriaceae bacterium]